MMLSLSGYAMPCKYWRNGQFLTFLFSNNEYIVDMFPFKNIRQLFNAENLKKFKCKQKSLKVAELPTSPLSLENKAPTINTSLSLADYPYHAASDCIRCVSTRASTEHFQSQIHEQNSFQRKSDVQPSFTNLTTFFMQDFSTVLL